MMDVLSKAKSERREEFFYTINQGGEVGIKVPNGSDRTVVIRFVDEVFHSVATNYNKDYNSRSTWHVNKAIAEKIAEIESSYMEAKVTGVISEL